MRRTFHVTVANSVSSSRQREHVSNTQLPPISHPFNLASYCLSCLYNISTLLSGSRRPQILLDMGIYENLAITWFRPPHREISVALTAQSLGALVIDHITVHQVKSALRSSRRSTSSGRLRPSGSRTTADRSTAGCTPENSRPSFKPEKSFYLPQACSPSPSSPSGHGAGNAQSNAPDVEAPSGSAAGAIAVKSEAIAGNESLATIVTAGEDSPRRRLRWQDGDQISAVEANGGIAARTDYIEANMSTEVATTSNELPPQAPVPGVRPSPPSELRDPNSIVSSKLDRARASRTAAAGSSTQRELAPQGMVQQSPSPSLNQKAAKDTAMSWLAASMDDGASSGAQAIRLPQTKSSARESPVESPPQSPIKETMEALRSWLLGPGMRVHHALRSA